MDSTAAQPPAVIGQVSIPGAGHPRPRDAAHRALPWSRLPGNSPAMRALETAIQRVADFECPVLITGETGCGKEEVARAIHAAGPRRGKPFVAVNCGGLTASLAESQLFGHEKGAFTGAFGPSLGAFRAASGGIVFLDEIGEMPPDMQPKLLRVLQRSEVTPVGATAAFPVDVQVIAATNRDLETDIVEQRFREDLFYRLNTIHLTVPPLRARPEDIPGLLGHFSAHFARQYDRPVWRPDTGLLARLQAYDWPGNVRQLVQFVQRLYIFEDRAQAVLNDLLRGVTVFAPPPPRVAGDTAEPTPPVAPPSTGAAPGDPAVGDEAGPEPRVPVLNLDELRRLAVRQALAAADGHRGKAAALLGVSLGTMTRLAAEFCPESEQRTGRRRGVQPRQPR
jgi:DNA-binding NtrC family response regulator